METIGQRLKTAREDKQMSVSDVAAATQVQVQTLLAIERDDFNSMPAPIYVRGFIKLYAECVGIDPEHLINAYNNRRSDVSDRTTRRQPTARNNEAPSSKTRRPFDPASGIKRISGKLNRFHWPKLPKLSTPNFSLKAVGHRIQHVFADFKTKKLPAARLWHPDIVKLKSVFRSGADWVRHALTHFSMPHIRLSPDVRRLIPLFALATVLVVFTILGWSCYSVKNRPRVFDSRFIQKPPDPYLE